MTQTLSDPVYQVLSRCHWVHALNMATSCEGCANDGEAGYCRGAGIDPYQPSPVELYCHCGHTVVMVELPSGCECDGPEGWHCPGEDSLHWAEWQRPDSPCGHCGGDPADLDDDLTDALRRAPNPDQAVFGGE